VGLISNAPGFKLLTSSTLVVIVAVFAPRYVHHRHCSGATP
jgi:hypothetical protein